MPPNSTIKEGMYRNALKDVISENDDLRLQQHVVACFNLQVDYKKPNTPQGFDFMAYQ